MYLYTVFGLVIASEIVCPELCVATGEPDITIRYGTLAHIQIPEQHRSGNHLISDQQFFININGVAKYLVTNGSEIIVDPVNKDEIIEVRLFLLGSVIGAILHQRGFLPIHGNGIVLNGECTIFAGRSGKGKSTLATAFAQKGFQLLCDDLCAIKISEQGCPVVMPGFPHVKLWPDSLRQIKATPSNLTPVHPGSGKYIFQLNTRYCHQAVPLKKIYILNFHNSESIKFQTLNTLDSIIILKKHTYKRRMVKKMNHAEAHYTLCAELVRAISVTRVLRPRNFKLLDTLIEQVAHQ